MPSLSDIRYIFQIPLEWFKAVHARLAKAYGSNFIDVKEGDQGGLEIGVNEDEFERAVISLIETHGGGSISGSIPFVSSVTWNGSQLVIGHSTATIVNGAIVITPNADTTINTITYNPS